MFGLKVKDFQSIFEGDIRLIPELVSQGDEIRVAYSLETFNGEAWEVLQKIELENLASSLVQIVKFLNCEDVDVYAMRDDCMSLEGEAQLEKIEESLANALPILRGDLI